MKTYETIEIVKKLIGKIGSVGETNYDNKCLENLNDWEELLFHLVLELKDEAQQAGCYQASVKENAKKARKILQSLVDELGEYGIKQRTSL